LKDLTDDNQPNGSLLPTETKQSKIEDVGSIEEFQISDGILFFFRFLRFLFLGVEICQLFRGLRF
jgi:hypothetical protein